VFGGSFTAGLLRVPAAGGKVETLTTPDASRAERTHRWPAALPDGKHVLFTVGSLRSPSNYDDAEIHVVDVATRQRRKVFQGGSMARFVPPDHLVFVRNATLMTVAFDPERLTFSGDPVPAVGKIAGDPSGGAGYAAVGGDGTLAFVQGSTAPPDRTLTIVDRKGTATDLPIAPRLFQAPKFSPDGTRLAFSVGSGGGADDDVYVCDLRTNTVTRLTFANSGISPIWSPDGKRIAFSSIIGGKEGVWAKPSDGSGAEELLDPLPGGVEYPTSWSTDGRFVAFTRAAPTVGVWLLPISSGRPGAPKEAQPSGTGGSLSPDGRYLAYSTGVFALGDVFVQPVDGSPGKWQVTTDRGGWPVWRGKEIFFLREGGDVWAVDVETDPSFRAGTPRLVARGEGRFTIRTAPLYPFDASNDGQRFALLKSRPPAAIDRIELVLNWGAELARGADAKKSP